MRQVVTFQGFFLFFFWLIKKNKWFSLSGENAPPHFVAFGSGKFWLRFWRFIASLLEHRTAAHEYWALWASRWIVWSLHIATFPTSYGHLILYNQTSKLKVPIFFMQTSSLVELMLLMLQIWTRVKQSPFCPLCFPSQVAACHALCSYGASGALTRQSLSLLEVIEGLGQPGSVGHDVEVVVQRVYSVAVQDSSPRTLLKPRAPSRPSSSSSPPSAERSKSRYCSW